MRRTALPRRRAWSRTRSTCASRRVTALLAAWCALGVAAKATALPTPGSTSSALARAQDPGAASPVTARVEPAEVWTGQRATLVVELRVQGRFDGDTAFSLPQVADTWIVGGDRPTVSSETVGGVEWFVQRHELSVFSQADGALEIPAFPVRYGAIAPGSIEGVRTTGDVPAVTLKVKRPPGSADLGFLVTCEELAVAETWTPALDASSDGERSAGPIPAGTALRRVVTQRADQVAGMALAPVPPAAPDGVRVYPRGVVVDDDTQRGAFTGARTETLDYLFQRAGTYELPALRFSWWDPKAERIESTTLPAVTVDVTPAPVVAIAEDAEDERGSRGRWIAALATALALTLAAWIGWTHHERLAAWRTHVAGTLGLPGRRARRRLQRACRANDPHEAYAAWNALARAPRNEEEHDAVRDLERALYANDAPTAWNGRALLDALRARSPREHATREHTARLPRLNA